MLKSIMAILLTLMTVSIYNVEAVTPDGFYIYKEQSWEFASDDIGEAIKTAVKDKLEERGRDVSDEQLDALIVQLEEIASDQGVILPDGGGIIIDADKSGWFLVGCLTPNIPLQVGDTIFCAAIAILDEEGEINDWHYWVYDSNNDLRYHDEASNLSGTIIGMWIPSMAGFVVDEVGEWNVAVQFTKDSIVEIELGVTFFVVSEGVLGAVTLAVSSVALLLVYSKSRSNRKHSLS